LVWSSAGYVAFSCGTPHLSATYHFFIIQVANPTDLHLN